MATKREVVVAVAGSRHRIPTDREFVEFFLLLSQRRTTEVWHGDCRGTDRAVARRCKDAGLKVRAFPVNTRLDGDWPGAGPCRNRRMLTSQTASGSRVSLLAAFAGGSGTASAKAIAYELEIEVEEIEER